MRILFISDPQTVHARRWAQGLAKSGNEVVFLAVRPGALKSVQVLYLDPGDLPAPKWLKFLRHLRFILRELRLIAFGGFDIVQVHFLRADLTGLTATLHPRCVVTVWGSDVRLPDPGASTRRQYLVNATLKRARVVTATNEFLSALVNVRTRGRRTAEVIPFGVDTELFKPLNPPRRNESPVRICLAKAGWAPTYGPDLAVQAFCLAAVDYPDLELHLAGTVDAALGAELTRLAQNGGFSDRVFFHGRLDEADLVKLLQLCDLFLQPSRWESFGVAVLEAWACGLPVVVTRVGGADELVRDGVDGLLVPEPDPAALARAVVTLARNPDLRRQMGEAGRRRVTAEFDFRQSLRRTEELYRRLLTTAAT